MKENRKTQRFEIKQIVKLSFDKQEQIEAEGINISEFGICCLVAKEMKPFTRLTIFLTILVEYDDVNLKCEGIVVWSSKANDGFKAGIEFFLIADDIKINLKKFVNSLTGKL